MATLDFDYELFREHYPNDHLVLAALVGSRAYNMSTPESDTDWVGVYVPEKPLRFAEYKNVHYKGKDGGDIAIFPIKNYLHMLLEANPNVFVVPGLEERFIYRIEPSFSWSLERELFLSRKTYHTFKGYAYSQLDAAFGITTGDLGEDRKSDLGVYGYVRKTASHTIRLLRMGLELVRDGELNVWRQDGDDLLRIRRGEWTKDEIKGEANRLFAAIEAARPGPLPERAQWDVVETLMQSTIMNELGYVKYNLE